uniref:ORF19 n=1 Tax=Malaco herpesvirus 4 TaxID=3031800 RepID=A0AA48P7N2_9VIRU|nr:TPA_asm: ORF19 [Malaco herpesvirus 4]
MKPQWQFWAGDNTELERMLLRKDSDGTKVRTFLRNSTGKPSKTTMKKSHSSYRNICVDKIKYTISTLYNIVRDEDVHSLIKPVLEELTFNDPQSPFYGRTTLMAPHLNKTVKGIVGGMLTKHSDVSPNRTTCVPTCSVRGVVDFAQLSNTDINVNARDNFHKNHECTKYMLRMLRDYKERYARFGDARVNSFNFVDGALVIPRGYYNILKYVPDESATINFSSLSEIEKDDFLYRLRIASLIETILMILNIYGPYLYEEAHTWPVLSNSLVAELHHMSTFNKTGSNCEASTLTSTTAPVSTHQLAFMIDVMKQCDEMMSKPHLDDSHTNRNAVSKTIDIRTELNGFCDNVKRSLFLALTIDKRKVGQITGDGASSSHNMEANDDVNDEFKYYLFDVVTHQCLKTCLETTPTSDHTDTCTSSQGPLNIRRETMHRRILSASKTDVERVSPNSTIMDLILNNRVY